MSITISELACRRIAPRTFAKAIRFARSVIEVGSKVQPQRQIYYFREMAMLCLSGCWKTAIWSIFINNVRQLLRA